jgi:UDP-N-acetylglucosamine 2-epimerase (non-hydrolysing)
MIRVINVAGARPNFMKIAPIVAAMKRRADEFQPYLVHTGQHYDAAMSDLFFRDLGMSEPDIYLGVGSASHAVQTATVMTSFEPIVQELKPDWVVVVGDVNSTLACALVCAKLGIKVAHVEAGLRSRDRSMPEEINRLVTDQIADLLLTPSQDGDDNLRAEGIPTDRIRFVGNIMIDSLFSSLKRAEGSTIRQQLNLVDKPYAVLTLHRPSNVDDRPTFTRLVMALEAIAAQIPIVFPAHPRTQRMIGELGLDSRIQQTRNLMVIDPVGYLDFLNLMSGARLVLTDSGGIQEETTALGIPCLTLRENTERPITVEMGTNTIVGTDTEKIKASASAALSGSSKSRAGVPPLWDGATADRILDAILEASGSKLVNA